MSSAILFVGLVRGASIGLMAAGLVLIYRTSRVFNFAHGTLAAAAAYAAAILGRSIPAPLAAVCGVAFAALAGAALERSSLRGLRGELPRTIVTLGWMLGMQAIISMVFGTSPYRTLRLFPTTGVRLGILVVGVDQVAVLLVALGFGLGGAVFLGRTRTGASLRAVADDPGAARLIGLPVPGLETLSWALGGSMAGLAGVLLAPSLALTPITLTVLAVQAAAVAVLARLESVGVAVIGGVGLGVVQTFVSQRVKGSPGIEELIALVVVAAALLLRKEQGTAWNPVNVPEEPWLPDALKRLRTRVRWVAGAAASLGGVLLISRMDSFTAWLWAGVFIFALAMLSIVVLAGGVGQVSLAQAEFMGLGAFVAGLLLSRGWGFGPAVLAGAGSVVPVAIVTGLPALRLRGLNLAIMTLALALAIDQFLFFWPPLVGPVRSRIIPRPALSFAGLDGERAFAVLCMIVFGLGALLFRNVLRHKTGQELLAVRGGEAAAQAVGVRSAVVKLKAFGLAGFLAGLAGAFYGALVGTAGPPSFSFAVSITLVAYTTLAGSTSVAGALVGGALLMLPSTSGGGSRSLPDLALLIPAVLLVLQIRLVPEGLASLALRAEAKLLTLVAGRLAPVAEGERG